MPNSLADRSRAARVPRAGARLRHADLRSVVTFRRDHPSDIGERHVIARLDGGGPIKLRFGESVSAELRPGRHHVRIHNTLFWKHIDFTIEPGEHLEFLAINRSRWWTAGVAGVLGSAPLFLTVVRRSVR